MKRIGKLEPRAAWNGKSHARKIAAVVRQLDKRRWVTAWAVALRLGISESTARKYLRAAVMMRRAEAEPSLNWTKLGATERMFRRGNR